MGNLKREISSKRLIARKGNMIQHGAPGLVFGYINGVLNCHALIFIQGQFDVFQCIVRNFRT